METFYTKIVSVIKNVFYICTVEQKASELLEQASAVFMRLGIKSVTMDDVARELGISKKTLYQFFEDKNDLIKKVFRFQYERDLSSITQASKTTKNAIDELIEVNNIMRTRMTNMRSSIMYDLQKYHPEAWKMFAEYKNKYIYQFMTENFERGVNEKYYNEGLKADIIIRIYLAKMEAIFDQQLFPIETYNIPDVHRELILYHIRSIANTKGLKYLEKKSKSK